MFLYHVLTNNNYNKLIQAKYFNLQFRAIFPENKNKYVFMYIYLQRSITEKFFM